MKIKNIGNIIYGIFILLLVVIAGAVFLSSFNTPLKFRLFNVQSGSMEPQIHTGSIVFVMPQDDYQVQDIITYRSERSKKETVTHRVVELIEDKELNKVSYITKGDANENPDPEPIAKRRVIGKVLFFVPYLGYAIAFAQSQLGLILLIIVPGTLIIYSEVINIKKEVTRMLKKRKKKQSNPKPQNKAENIKDKKGGIVIKKSNKTKKVKKVVKKIHKVKLQKDESKN